MIGVRQQCPRGYLAATCSRRTGTPMASAVIHWSRLLAPAVSGAVDSPRKQALSGHHLVSRWGHRSPFQRS